MYKPTVKFNAIGRINDGETKETPPFVTDINDYIYYRQKIRGKMGHNIRNIMYDLRYKGLNTISIGTKDFRNYLESKFKYQMNWSNYGLWTIDHIESTWKYNLFNTNDVITCNFYTNLQPVWREENTIKGLKEDAKYRETFEVNTIKMLNQDGKLEIKPVSQIFIYNLYSKSVKYP